MKKLIPFLALLFCAAANKVFAVGYLADFSIYDRTEQRALPVYYHYGRYYVVGKPGNEYQINLRNQDNGDVLAVVSVDGINVITGTTASPNQSGYVLNSFQSMDIKGWRKSLDRIAAFYFTSLFDSYAGRTGRPGNVGVIGVALFKRKVHVMPMPQPYYHDGVMEPEYKKDSSKERAESDAATNQAPAAKTAPSSSVLNEPVIAQRKQEKKLGTGHGRNETSHAQYVEFERASDFPAEVITIYYDSYRNLLAKGVISTPYYGYAKEPQAFPNQFTPDPPGGFWR